MSFDAGSLMVRIEAQEKQFMQGMQRVETTLKSGFDKMGGLEQKMSGGFASMGRSAAMFGAVANQAIGVALSTLRLLTSQMFNAGVASVKMAGDAGEVGSKFEAVFGNQTQAARDSLYAFGAAVGRSKLDLEQMASSVQDQFVPLGFARDQAAQLSVAMTKLGVDLASFNNMQDTEAMEAIKSALIGNHETVRRFGIIITETTLNMELMRMGIRGGTAAASEQQKVMARMNMIMRGTADAHGDATRTADSFANTSKRLWAVVSDLGVKLGTAIIPSLKVFMEYFMGIGSEVDEGSDAFTAWGERATQAAEWIVEKLDVVVQWFMQMPKDVETVSAMTSAFFGSIGDSIVGTWDWVIAMSDATWAALGDGIQSFRDGATETWNGFIELLGVNWAAWEQLLQESPWLAAFVDNVKAGADVINGIIDDALVAMGLKAAETGAAIEDSLSWGDMLANYDLLWEGMMIGAEQALTTAWERTVWFAENSWTAIKWFFTNFLDIAVTYANNYIQMWVNVATRFKEIWAAIWKMIKTGGKQGFDQLVGEITASMKAFPESPEFQAFSGTDFNDRWAEHGKRWEDRLKKMGDAAETQGQKVDKALKPKTADYGVDLQKMFKTLPPKIGVKVDVAINNAESLFSKAIEARFNSGPQAQQIAIADATKQGVEKLVNMQQQNTDRIVQAVERNQGAT